LRTIDTEPNEKKHENEEPKNNENNHTKKQSLIIYVKCKQRGNSMEIFGDIIFIIKTPKVPKNKKIQAKDLKKLIYIITSNK
jgi:hypothetical protein